jgi:hypothetical protein
MPCPSVALSGEPGVLRRRIGDDRVPYEVNDEVVTVLVAKIGHGATCIHGGGDGANSALFLAVFQARDWPRRIDRLCCAIEFRS